MRKSVVFLATSSLILSAIAVVSGAGPVSAASNPPTQGVTATSIRVGIPYVDLAAVRQFGITLDQGSFPDAYQAIIANLNAEGGINGRHVVPYLVAVNPVGTGPAITACTQLAEDDEVFVALAPQQPDCFLQQHHVPTISGSFQDVQSPGDAPNFTLEPPLAAYDPLQLSVLAHRGVFKGKKVGLFAGTETDGSELKVVQTVLKALGVHALQSAIDGAPQDDEVATNQQAAIIAQRFQLAGVNEVIAVGTGATVWPELPIWRSIGSHPSSQMGREAQISPPISFASFSARGIFSGALMPRPTETKIGACVRSTACLASRNRSSGLVRICSGFNSTPTDFTGAVPLECLAARSARKALAWKDAIQGASPVKTTSAEVRP